jgi:hypothetical protein
MSIIKKHFDWVKEQLEKHPSLRDNNERLYFLFLKESEYDTNKSIIQFLRDMSFREVPYIDSISRCSRKCQELYPELRGTSYKERVVKKEMKVRQEIRDLENG